MPSVNGVPSVTEILQGVGLTRDYSFLPAGRRDQLSQTGKWLGQAIQWYHEGTLDTNSLSSAIRPGFDAYLEFLEDEGWEWLGSEVELFHPWGFCGHLDLFGIAPDVGVEVLDIKFTDAPDMRGASLQLAGYGILYDHNAPSMRSGRHYPLAPHVRRRILQLTRDGHYKTHDVTDAHWTSVFSAAVVVYKEAHRK
jgi:hypothetical protein